MNEQTTTNTSTTEQPVTTTEHAAPAKAPKTKKAKPAKKAKATVKKAAAKAEKKDKRKAKVATDGLTGPAVLKKYAPNYVHDKEHKTPSGNPSVHCGDEVAKKFLGKSLDDIYSIVSKATETPMTELRKKYAGLNLGMQRMNLGNRLRGVLNAK